MLVAADPVEAVILGIQELAQIFVVEVVDPAAVDPGGADRPFMRLAVEVRIRHQVEEAELHPIASAGSETAPTSRSAGITSAAKVSMFLRVRSAGSVPNCSIVSRWPKPI